MEFPYHLFIAHTRGQPFESVIRVLPPGAREDDWSFVMARGRGDHAEWFAAKAVEFVSEAWTEFLESDCTSSKRRARVCVLFQDVNEQLRSTARERGIRRGGASVSVVSVSAERIMIANAGNPPLTHLAGDRGKYKYGGYGRTLRGVGFAKKFDGVELQVISPTTGIFILGTENGSLGRVSYELEGGLQNCVPFSEAGIIFERGYQQLAVEDSVGALINLSALYPSK